jgi:Protein of unknown function (DUF2585)
MPVRSSQSRPLLITGGIFALTGLLLLLFGRPLWCACGRPNPICLDAFSDHTSQHLFDPYSLCHLLKGLAYCGLVAWAFPRLPWQWGLCLAVGLEACWELVENSPFVIERYRTHTVAQNYQGDTIANSLGDIFSSAVGFLIARRIGLWPSVALFVMIELFLLWCIRDNLTLTVVMLVYPLEAVKAWQAGGG